MKEEKAKEAKTVEKNSCKCCCDCASKKNVGWIVTVVTLSVCLAISVGFNIFFVVSRGDFDKAGGFRDGASQMEDGDGMPSWGRSGRSGGSMPGWGGRGSGNSDNDPNSGSSDDEDSSYKRQMRERGQREDGARKEE